MKKRLTRMLAAILTCGAMSAQAQKLEIVDKDGNAVPYASIMTTDAKIIGTTGLDGILEDAKGADTISISHVAYKAKKVKLGGKGGRITLEEADFDLPEITVTKKPLIYQQIYYRIIFANDSAGLIYYRAGIMENGIECKTKKINTDENHISMSPIGILKTLLNAGLNSRMNKWVENITKPAEQHLKGAYKDVDLKFTPDGANRQRITDKYGDVGYVVDEPEAGLRRVVYDSQLLGEHLTKAKGKAKEIKKWEERQAKQKNRQDNDYAIYRLNEDGAHSPDDLVTLQNSTSYEKENSGYSFIIMEFYTTDRAYVTKDELKKIRKDNKMKMTYANIRQFEQQHKIQPLPTAVQRKINDFAAKKK